MRFQLEMKLVLCISLFLLCIFIFFSSNTSASTITVPDDYSTIQEAVSNASDGDTIFVRAGTYNENIYIDSSTFVPEPASLTLRGDDRESIIKDGSIRIHGDYQINISSFTVMDGSISYSYGATGEIYDNEINAGGGIGSSFSNVSIHDNLIQNSTSDGISIGGGDYSPVIARNLIINNGNESFDAGIRCEGTSTIIIDNILINNYNGIHSVRDNLMIINTTIDDSDNLDIILRIGENQVSTAINCIFESIAADGANTLIVKNYLNISIVDVNEIPLPNSDIKISDNDNIIYSTQNFGGFHPKTDSNGEIKWILITDRIYYSKSTPSENRTNVEVYYSNEIFESNPRNVDMSTSHTEIFQVQNKPPIVSITYPMESQDFMNWENITFSGEATDPENGELSGKSLNWSSDLNGIIGHGITISLSNLSIGEHEITLIASDSLGGSSTAFVNISIYLDTDWDGIPDLTDSDDDNDNLTDSEEIGKGSDPLDKDSDDDGYEDDDDAFPLDYSEWLDSDSDGTGDNEDDDDDNDGVADYIDVFPLDASEWKDSDKDGIGDNADNDDDNDDILDKDEAYYIGPIHIAFLVLMAILIIAPIILMKAIKRKRSDPNTHQSKEISAQHPILQSQRINCPSCGSSFEVTNMARPLAVHCPQCGTKGTLYD